MLGSWCNFYHFSDGGWGGGGAQKTQNIGRLFAGKQMNELPVIGSLRLRKEFWDRHGTNIVTRYKGTCGERLL